MHLDSRLNLKHICQKNFTLNKRIRKLYKLVVPHSEFTNENKSLQFVAIIKPICIYNFQLWGCASKSNIDLLQRYQNTALQPITVSYWFKRNNAIDHDDAAYNSRQNPKVCTQTRKGWMSLSIQ